MPDRDHLQPDSWDIVDHPNGWDLRWRPPVTRLLPGLPVFYGRLPKSLVTSQAFWSWYYGVFVAVLAIELYIRYGIRSPYAVSPILALCVAMVRQYLFHDVALNAERLIVVRDGRLRIATGVFSDASLRSLRLIPDRARRGRRWLVFAGTSLAEAVLVGAPGLKVDTAQELLEELLTRIR
ncbi:MAG: hypothetical protein O2931_01890 [Planctomycetota bacterium]|nr:hypothetical protein [Planctomycetota bacterium]MDA1177525.1 hypothetical protein [Planctomycetota bacterium]